MNILKLIRRLWCKHEGLGITTYIPHGHWKYGAGFGKKGSKMKLKYDITYQWECSYCSKIEKYKVRSNLTHLQAIQYMNNPTNTLRE
jgi:hypothetical protein